MNQRATYFQVAYSSAPAMVMRTVGAGSKYPTTLRDTDGDFLDGGQSYRLHLPPDPPAALWRYRYDKFGWTTRSSQLYEDRLLRWGSPMFHFGMLWVVLGHFLGLVIPKSWAISERTLIFADITLIHADF